MLHCLSGVCAAKGVDHDAVVDAAAHAGVRRDADVVESKLDEPLLSARWTTIVSAPWNSEEHINSLELGSISTAVRWVLSSPVSVRRRVLVLSDSQFAVGALSKGRSSAHVILRRLRSISALVQFLNLLSE